MIILQSLHRNTLYWPWDHVTVLFILLNSRLELNSQLELNRLESNVKIHEYFSMGAPMVRGATKQHNPPEPLSLLGEGQAILAKVAPVRLQTSCLTG